MLFVKTTEDVDRHLELIAQAAAGVRAWMATQTGDPLDILRRMKFDPVGQHPIEGHPLNLVEQINQSWTYAVALVAARQLLRMHPEAAGYRLEPGAHAAQPLDIMSQADALVGAETFAAVHPANNRKLAKDLAKLAARPERYRYVFFLSPKYPGSKRIPALERDGVQVWSVDV
jgi:hypothetical protein